MIFVTGCARSGTSLITHLLQAHGCYLGKPNRINVLYENVTIRENILKSYLMCIDADPLGQDKLPDTDKLPLMHDLSWRVLACLEEGPPPLCYKDAKLSLVWPVFHDAFPQAKWVVVRRDKARIVDSCMRTLFMRKRKTPAAWTVWVEEHEMRFAKMRRKLDMVEVWTDEVIEDAEAFRPVAEHCGLAFSPSTVERIIEPKRWHAVKPRLPQTHRSSA